MNSIGPGLDGTRIFVAGHGGMVGSAIVRALAERKVAEVLTRAKQDLDLTDQRATNLFIGETRPDVVVVAAGRVGGIEANRTRPADFIYENLMIESNLIRACFDAGVDRVLFLGSSCIYPREAPQPMKEDFLLQGSLESTNEPYAIAKIAGIKLCESFNRQYGTHYRSLMPTNLYGPNDNFDIENSHVIPALIRKFHVGKENGDRSVEIWGTGRPIREFLHVDDLAEACLFVMGVSDAAYAGETAADRSFLNVGTGVGISIRDLAGLIAEIVGYEGELVFQVDRPDGTMEKVLDVSRLRNLGWSPRRDLRQGLTEVYAWYRENAAVVRGN